ncbi:MAG TPA: hypothetical protein VML94_05260 [Thermoplasmata archaeon]|nr:hypothetical protein [Thermoplasmata archaeon]
MPESQEQAQFRQHLREISHATAGLGRDFKHEVGDLDQKIERFGRATGKEAKYLALDIQDGLSNLGHSVDEEVRRIPGRIASAGTAIGAGTARAAGAARDAVVIAGKRAKEGTKNAFAAAAGVRRTPMREWSAPSDGAESGASSPSDDR